MRQFAQGGFRIWNLSREAKLVYTAFGLFSLLALVVSTLFYEDLVGKGTPGVAGYYAGGAPAPGGAAPPAPAEGGPRLELPDEAHNERALTVAVTYRKLLEVTHFHLFTVPVFLLIVAHLFMITGLRPGTKMVWIAGAWGSALVHLAAPWLVRYGSAAWSPVYGVSGALLGVTSTVLTVYPVWAMWAHKPGAGRARGTQAAE